MTRSKQYKTLIDGALQTTFGTLLALAALLGASAALASAVPERSGSWYDPGHDGEGFIVQFFNDSSATVYWFTYTPEGDQRWFLGVGQVSGNELVIDELQITRGGVFGPDFDPAAIERIDVGELTIRFDSDSAALASYTVDGVSGQQSLQRLTRPVEVMAADADGIPHKSGSWYDPGRDGEGIVLEILPDGRQVAYWFTYDVDGNQAWMLSLGNSSAAQGSFQLDLQQPVGGRFGPDFDPADVVREAAGTVRVGVACQDGFGRFESTDLADFVDVNFRLQRIVGIGPEPCTDPALTNLYPRVNGAVAVPDHDAGRQLSWFLGKLADNSPITDQEISDRFSSSWLSQNSIAATRTLIENARRDYPGARLTDPVNLSLMSMSGLVTGSTGNEGYFLLETNLSDAKISSLSMTYWGRGAGTVVTAADANLTLEQAADRFATLSGVPGLVVARIDESNQCRPLIGRNESAPRSTASIFKIWILGGVADALNDRVMFHDDVVPLTESRKTLGGPLLGEPNGLPLTIDELSTLMIGISENTATDMLLFEAGRDRFDGLHAEYGHQSPELMAPQLGISEQFHLFSAFSMNEAMSYVNGTEAFQRQFLEERIVPLGPWRNAPNGWLEPLFIDGAWSASALDVCSAFARHRQHTPGSDAALVVERAMQVSVAQPNLREKWDRIWYKGGSLASPQNGFLVLTHAFMLEREGEQPIAVVGLSNDYNGNIDQFAVQSTLGRILELAAEL